VQETTLCIIHDSCREKKRKERERERVKRGRAPDCGEHHTVHEMEERRK
jgi:hypothetical protein